MVDRMYDASAPSPCPLQVPALRSRCALLTGASQSSALGTCQLGIVTEGSHLSSQMPKTSRAPVLASEPARCDLGKSVKETNNGETGNKLGKGCFPGSEADGDPRESGRENQQTSNKQRILQQQHHQEGETQQMKHVLFVCI